MRLTPFLLLLTISAGCRDVIGLGGSCSLEMQSVRRAEGPPDHTQESRNGGDFEERWIYQSAPGEAGRVYTFRWGSSYESCEDSGPAPLDVLPPGDPRIPETDEPGV